MGRFGGAIELVLADIILCATAEAAASIPFFMNHRKDDIEVLCLLSQKISDVDRLSVLGREMGREFSYKDVSDETTEAGRQHRQFCTL